MTKEELLKLPPGTLVDVTVDGKFLGTHPFCGVRRGARALLVGVCESYGHEQISLHTPQPQVSGTIETPPKLYTLRFGHGIPATEEQIMAQECVRESRNTIDVLNEEIANRNERISRLRGQVEDLVGRLEAPPTTDEVEHAYNTLIVADYKNEASVLRTLSHVVERLSERLEELEQLPDVEND